MNRKEKKQLIINTIAELEAYRERKPVLMSEVAYRLGITRQALNYYVQKYRTDIDSMKQIFLKKLK